MHGDSVTAPFEVSKGLKYRATLYKYPNGSREAKLIQWPDAWDAVPLDAVEVDGCKRHRPVRNASVRVQVADMNERQLEKFEDNVRRAKTKVRRLAMCLNTPRMLTLTYLENMTDPLRGWRDWKAFVRLYHARYPDFRYVVSMEFQKRGAVHFHAICRNSTKSDWIDVHYARTCWLRVMGGKGKGNIHVSPVKSRSANAVARACNYVAKYITKCARELEPGSHRYRCSNGIELSQRHVSFRASSWLEAKRRFCRAFASGGSIGSVFVNDYELFGWCASWGVEARSPAEVTADFERCRQVDALPLLSFG